MTTETRQARRRLLRAAGLVLLELLPYLLVGIGAGLVFLPAGFLAPGLLWWVADRLDGRTTPPTTGAAEREEGSATDVHA